MLTPERWAVSYGDYVWLDKFHSVTSYHVFGYDFVSCESAIMYF